jgi:simple sugar transport system permease protein
LSTTTRARPAFSLIDFLVTYGVLVVFAVIFVGFWAFVPGFGSADNIVSIFQAQAVAGICALGMTLAAVVGDLDLSVGATAGLSVTVAAVTMIEFNLTGGTAILFCILAGVLVGVLNAVLIVVLRIPDLLATLGMMFTVQGLKKWLVDGQTLTTGMTLSGGDVAKGRFTADFTSIDGGRLLGIPYSVYLFVVLAILVWVFLERTRYGRVFYAVGGNPEAARLAGARVNRYRFGAYLMSGVLAAIGGIILASRLRQGDVTAGDSALLDAVAMTLVGFAVLGAKKANAFGTFVGAMFIGTILQGLVQLGLPYYTQDLIKGLVLVFALLMSFSLRRRRRKVVGTVEVPGEAAVR